MITDDNFVFLVYHPKRYNTTLDNKCAKSPCSHLCLLVPGGHHCACPDNTTPISHRSTVEVVCDARKLLLRQLSISVMGTKIVCLFF